LSFVSVEIGCNYILDKTLKEDFALMPLPGYPATCRRIKNRRSSENFLACCLHHAPRGERAQKKIIYFDEENFFREKEPVLGLNNNTVVPHRYIPAMLKTHRHHGHTTGTPQARHIWTVLMSCNL
jgi:hypothetical protein